MAIAIPALVDAQLVALRASMEPVQDGATFQDSFAAAPGGLANRMADMLDMLTSLCDSGTLTGVGIHTAVDATNNIAVAAAASDLATTQTLLNALRDGTGEAGGGAPAHFIIVGASEHIGADVTNALTAAAATDLPTSLTLANDIKTEFNGHLLLHAATGHYGPDLVNTILSPDATDLPTAIILANELKTKYNLHLANIKAGSTLSFVDNGAFTTANSLVGTTITFAAATTTAALRDLVRTVVSSSVNHLVLNEALPAEPVVGDTLTLEYTQADANITVLRGTGVSFGGTNPGNPYGYGPSFVDAVLTFLQSQGVTPPSYLNTASAEPFGLGSPHAGHGGTHGHAALILASDMLQLVRDTVAAYTVPT